MSFLRMAWQYLRTITAGLLLLSLWSGLVSVQAVGQSLSFPELTGRVVDQADLLSPEQEASLTAQLETHEVSTSNQVVVVTIPSLEGQPISDYGYQLGRHWGIGQRDKNNGVLLIVAVDDRKMRIEVGYGLEAALSDGVASDIIQHHITPAFKANDYPQGIQEGVNHILQAIAGEYEVIGDQPQNTLVGNIFLLIFPVIFSLPLLSTVVGLVKGDEDILDVENIPERILPAAMFGGVFGFIIWSTTQLWWVAILVGLLIGINILFSKSVTVGSGGSSGGFGGGGSYSSGGGGGFSGGGGSFGGGGASGGW